MDDNDAMEDTALVAGESVFGGNTANAKSADYSEATDSYDPDRYTRETLVSQLLPYYGDDPLKLVAVAGLLVSYINGNINVNMRGWM
jgi:hypothetical protein